jgi:hypothetical protein
MRKAGAKDEPLADGFVKDGAKRFVLIKTK